MVPLLPDALVQVVMCVALNRTGGVFEENVAKLARERGMTETIDFWFFV